MSKTISPRFVGPANPGLQSVGVWLLASLTHFHGKPNVPHLSWSASNERALTVARVPNSDIMAGVRLRPLPVWR